MNGLSNIQEYGRLYVIQMERKLRLNLLRWHMICHVKNHSVLSDTGIDLATHPGEESLEMQKNLCTTDSAAREIRKNGMGALVKCMQGTSGMKLENFIKLWEDNYEQINHDGTSSK